MKVPDSIESFRSVSINASFNANGVPVATLVCGFYHLIIGIVQAVLSRKGLVPDFPSKMLFSFYLIGSSVPGAWGCFMFYQLVGRISAGRYIEVLACNKIKLIFQPLFFEVSFILGPVAVLDANDNLIQGLGVNAVRKSCSTGRIV